MTSACGVVEEVHTDEVGLYEGRVDRKARAAIKGQKAITVPFVQSTHITRDFVEDVEKQLNIDGRHTYLYQPADGEDIAGIVKHLHRAGIIVLLLLTEKQDQAVDKAKIDNFVSDIDVENIKEAEEIATFIAKASVYEETVQNGGYI